VCVCVCVCAGMGIVAYAFGNHCILCGGGGGIYTWVNLVESGGGGTGEVSTFSRGVGGLWH
jgi:hypothetical protein